MRAGVRVWAGVRAWAGVHVRAGVYARFPYFWQSYLASYQAKCIDELENLLCVQYFCLFPYFLYIQSIPTVLPF